MKKSLHLVLLILLCTCVPQGGRAQSAAADSSPTDSEIVIDRPHAQEWFNDISAGWSMQEGDSLAWAAPGFDDSRWESVRLDDLGPSQPGWRWFRIHLKLHENHPELALLIQGGVGTYELYINGARIPDPQLRSSFGVNRPVERMFTIDDPATDLVIALRTHTPTGYAAWRLPQFMSAYLGTTDAIDAQRQVVFLDRTSSQSRQS